MFASEIVDGSKDVPILIYYQGAGIRLDPAFEMSYDTIIPEVTANSGNVRQKCKFICINGNNLFDSNVNCKSLQNLYSTDLKSEIYTTCIARTHGQEYV